MATSAVQATVLHYTSYKSNLETKLMHISEQRITLARRAANLAIELSNSKDEDATLNENPEYLKLEAMDKELEQEQKKAETQQEAATQALNSYQQLLNKNIQSDFKIMGGS